MKATVIRRTGGRDVIENVRDWPMPKRDAGEVLIRIQASSVNPIDAYVRQGAVGPVVLPKV